MEDSRDSSRLKGTESGVRKSGGVIGKRNLEENFKGKQRVIKKLNGGGGTRNYNTVTKGNGAGGD